MVRNAQRKKKSIFKIFCLFRIATINKAAVEHSVFGGDIKTEMVC